MVLARGYFKLFHLCVPPMLTTPLMLCCGIASPRLVKCAQHLKQLCDDVEHRNVVVLPRLDLAFVYGFEVRIPLPDVVCEEIEGRPQLPASALGDGLASLPLPALPDAGLASRKSQKALVHSCLPRSSLPFLHGR